MVIRVAARKTTAPTISTTAPISVYYACNNNKSIRATYVTGAEIVVAQGEQPIPSGKIELKLSDGRAFTLNQTISADGTRYANPDESFVFWGKGNGALVLENNQAKSYIGCVVVKPDTGGLTEIYQNGTDGYSLRYPTGYTVDEKYIYQALGPGKDIYGTKFTIPTELTKNTNLSTDTYFSVELIPKTENCTAGLFLDKDAQVKDVTENDTVYSMGTTSGAGAGNRYEETVYAMHGTNPCLGIRYFVHYGAIENYPVGVVQEFNKNALLKTFDEIRQTITINL